MCIDTLCFHNTVKCTLKKWKHYIHNCIGSHILINNYSDIWYTLTFTTFTHIKTIHKNVINKAIITFRWKSSCTFPFSSSSMLFSFSNLPRVVLIRPATSKLWEHVRTFATRVRQGAAREVRRTPAGGVMCMCQVISNIIHAVADGARLMESKYNVHMAC